MKHRPHVQPFAPRQTDRQCHLDRVGSSRHHCFVHRAHCFRHAVGRGKWINCKGMDIGPDLPLRFAEDLPDLAQNDIRIAASVRRLRIGPQFEPDQW